MVSVIAPVVHLTSLPPNARQTHEELKKLV